MTLVLGLSLVMVKRRLSGSHAHVHNYIHVRTYMRLKIDELDPLQLPNREPSQLGKGSGTRD